MISREQATGREWSGAPGSAASEPAPRPVGALGDNHPVTPDRNGRPAASAASSTAPGPSPGRGELPGPRLQRGRRDPALHAVREGRLAHRRRRQRVRRPDLLVGPDAARARPPRGAGGGRGRGVARDVVRHRPPSPRSSSPRRSSRARRWTGSASSPPAPRRRCPRSVWLVGFTGRDVIVKFAGCYHGHVDSLLASAGSGAATLRGARHPRGPGLVDGADAGAAVQRPDRGREGVRRARRPDRLPDHRGRPRQHGRRPARAGFNAFLAETCTRHGALFVSDEVMTGFRASRTGSGVSTAPPRAGGRTC